MRNRQIGPDDAADILADVVANITYKPGWSMWLQEISRGQGCEGLTLLVQATVPDTCNEGESITFLHLMPVLPAAYDRENWVRWVFEQLQMVELHECLEWFRVDDRQPYFPEHAPGKNPYARVEIKSQAEAFAPAVPWVGGAPVDEHFA